jgi:predicted secreted hydrolase
MDMTCRRLLLKLPLLSLLPVRAGAAADDFDAVRPGVVLTLPRDHGAHPGFRIEWWYVTGWLERQGAADTGFQLTFFRVRQPAHDANPSRFAPSQILLAHAAVSDASHGRLRHAQKVSRAGFGLASAAANDLDVRIDGWHLVRQAKPERLFARVDGEDFAYALDFTPTQPVLRQGEEGFSRKSADPVHASHYLSWPQLSVSGSLTLAGATAPVRGRAWLDHEWSSALMPADAAGWDWLGLNLDDGGALMVFRMRAVSGGDLWAAATVRDAAGRRAIDAADIAFTVSRTWRSPRTGGRYPVELDIRVGVRVLSIRPLMDDQELDSRASTGAIYWEGAVTAFEHGRRAGRGYLELTGYVAPLKL